jgi:prepilin peptidase CpaA
MSAPVLVGFGWLTLVQSYELVTGTEGGRLEKWPFSPTHNPVRRMVSMIAEFFLILLLPAALIAAAGWDIATYTIPNFIQLVLLAAFPVFALVVGMPFAAFGYHALAGLLGLLFGFTLFAFGFIGGGDAKLFACVALWLGLGDFASFALIATIFGGALTLGILFFRKLPLPAFLTSHSWVMRLHDEKGGVPYGVALASGAFVVLPYTDIFRAGFAG